MGQGRRSRLPWFISKGPFVQRRWYGAAWYSGISLAGILLMAVVAFYGFYTSLGGRPVFGGAKLEE